MSVDKSREKRDLCRPRAFSFRNERDAPGRYLTPTAAVRFQYNRRGSERRQRRGRNGNIEGRHGHSRRGVVQTPTAVHIGRTRGRRRVPESTYALVTVDGGG